METIIQNLYAYYLIEKSDFLIHSNLQFLARYFHLSHNADFVSFLVFFSVHMNLFKLLGTFNSSQVVLFVIASPLLFEL